MKTGSSVPIPTQQEFLDGCREFRLREGRDAMYKVASYLVNQFWGDPDEMADGLGVLLLTWNQAFYRYGPFSFEELEQCIEANLSVLESYRTRDILTLNQADEVVIRGLFDAFLTALAIHSGKNKGRKSPVAAAKALHLLCPAFFPLWDEAIAGAYGCFYDVLPSASYVRFSRMIRELADAVRNYTIDSGRTVVKRIDEYNYAKFTKDWV